MPLPHDRGRLHLGPDELVGLVDGGHEGVREVVGIEPVRVDHEHDVIPGRRGAAPEQSVLCHLPHDGDVDGVVVAVGMHMTADDGDAELPDPVLHPADDLLADVPVDDRHDIDHPERPPAHGGDVVDIDEDGEVPRIIGVGLHQGFHDPVRGEEDVLVPHVYRGGVLPLGGGHLREVGCRQEIHDLVYRVLPGDPGVVPDRIRQLAYQRHNPFLLSPQMDSTHEATMATRRMMYMYGFPSPGRATFIP